MRILVTGGAGFTGSHVAEFSAKKGEDVIVYNNLSRSEILGEERASIKIMYNWNYLKQTYPRVQLVKGDIGDFKQLRTACKDFGVIVHAVAQVAVTTSVDDPGTDFEINALGTFNVLEAAGLNDATVIFCSTNKVYGENVNKIPIIEKETRYEYADPSFKDGIPEDYPIDLTGHSPYGCSKLAADIYVQDYAHTYGLRTAVFRQSCIYGEREFGVEDQGWVAWFTIATLTDRPVTIYGDGKQVRDVLYVQDLVKAFDAFLNSKVKHEVFNVGGGTENTLSLLELIDLLKKLTGKTPRLTFDDWRPADQKVYVSNIKKLSRLLLWRPKVEAEEGVRRLLKWVSDYSRQLSIA